MRWALNAEIETTHVVTMFWVYSGMVFASELGADHRIERPHLFLAYRMVGFCNAAHG